MPDSKLQITDYYIIIYQKTNSNSDSLEIHTIKNYNTFNMDYIIHNLKNNEMYNVILISKNLQTISDISNSLNLIPNSNSDFGKPINNSFSNSLENSDILKQNKELYKKVREFRQQKTQLEKMSIYSDLKGILFDELQLRIDKNVYNINIF